MKSICVFASHGLGDGLLALILARTVERLGHSVTIFSTPLLPLSPWIPWAKIAPFVDYDQLDSELNSFDHIIAADHSRATHKGEVVSVDRHLTMVENFELYLHKTWGRVYKIGAKDLDLPPQLIHRKYVNRVIIHPTSGAEQRNWPREKFLLLAQKLRHRGFEPIFMISAQEVDKWLWFPKDQFSLKAFSDLKETAAYVYESGYFIGNDSGPGHLASLFHIPTLSLFARASYARLWRPGWGPGIVVTPSMKLPGAHLKERYWKQLLTVNKVLQKFHILTA